MDLVVQVVKHNKFVHREADSDLVITRAVLC